jgi:phosphotransferase system  glucose/maltose/N-acetylglucosamine-specific IIC component
MNPIAAMKQSWRLTKGNSLRIFVFVFVVFVIIGLISLVASLVLGTVFAAFGGAIATIGTSAVGGLTGAISGGLFLLILAAIHRQLSGSGEQSMVDTFE